MSVDIAKLGLEVDSQGFVRATGHMQQYRKEAQQVESTTQRMQRQLDQIGGSMQRAGRTLSLRLTAPLVAMGGAAVKSFADFDDAMVRSLAIMGDVSEMQRDQMSSAARQMAKETVFSASQAAESYFFLASAGLSAEQSVAALPQVAKFAQAGMFDMARATDLATDAQSALGMTVQDAQQNLRNLTHVTDVLVGANTLANASVEQFSEALTNKAGNAMRQLNIEVESGVAVLAAWADQGVKGSEAGERFNIVTRDLQRAARNNREEFEKFNVSVFDAEGNFRNMADIVGDLENVLGTMSVEQQGATLQMMGFQDRSVQALRSLIGLSDQVREYEDQLRTMGGITEEVADKQLESFKAQMGLLRSEINDVFITIGEGLVPIIKDMRDEIDGIIPKMAEWAEKFRDADDGTKRLVTQIGFFAAALGPLLIVLGTVVRSAGALIPVFRGMFKTVGPLIPLIGKLSFAKVTLGAAAVAAGYNIGTRLHKAISELRKPISETEPVLRSMERRFNRLEKNRLNQKLREDARNMDLMGMSAEKLELEIAKLERTERRIARTRGDHSKTLNELRERLDKAREALQLIKPEVEDTEEEIEKLINTIDDGNDPVEKFEQLLRDQIDALRRQRLELEGGTRAVLMYELAQVKAAGATDEQVRHLEALIEQIVKAEAELDTLRNKTEETTESNKTFTFGMEDVIKALLELQKEYRGASEEATYWEKTTDRALSDVRTAFAAFITGEIDSFSDFADTVTRIFQRMWTDIIDQAIQADLIGTMQAGGSFSQGMQAFMGGAGGQAMFESAAAQFGAQLGDQMTGRTGGYADMGASVGAMIGSIFGPIGTILGSILGGLAGSMFGSRPPRFDLAGRGTAGDGFMATNPEWFTTAMGVEVGANFRRMESEQEDAIRSAILDFDALMARTLENTPFFEAAQQALSNVFTFESRFVDDPASFIQVRFDAVLGTFDGFIQDMVRREGSLEDQMQALGDIVGIHKFFEEAGGFAGLGFEETVRAMDALRTAGETLGDTFKRVTGAFQQYAGMAAQLESTLMMGGLNDFQKELVNIQLDLRGMTRGLNEAAQAAGLNEARTIDMARAHEVASNRMAAAVAKYEDAARSIVEDLFGTELSRLQDEIARMRGEGAEDEDIADLLEKEAEIQQQNEERRRIQQAQELAQMVADLSQATGDSFEDVATRLGFELNQLGDILGLDDERLMQMLEDLQVDPMAIADQLVDMTDRIVGELILLPGAFADALRGAEDGVPDPTAPPLPPDTGIPAPGRPGPGIDDQTATAIKDGTGATTDEVAGLREEVTILLNGQQALTGDVAAALNNLADALRRADRGSGGQSRSTRTRTEIA